jgi:hypothetical protein
LGSPLLDLINVKYVLVPSTWSIQSPFLEVVYDEEIRIYENKNGFPRAFVVPSYLLCNSRESAYAALGTFTLADFQKKVILESEPPPLLVSGGDEKDVQFSVAEVQYGRDKIDIRVSCPRGGFLVLSDNYHTSWKAKVDGTEKPILRANYTMMSVALAPGSQKVEFRFYDIGLHLGPTITALGWILLGVWTCVWLRRGSKDNYQDKE